MEMNIVLFIILSRISLMINSVHLSETNIDLLFTNLL